MQSQGLTVQKKIVNNGVSMFRENWFYLHPKMLNFRGQMVQIIYSKSNFGSISIYLPDGEMVEASLSSVISKNSKTLTVTDSHLRKVIEIHRHSLEQILEAKSLLEVFKIAEDSIEQTDQIFLLHNEEITNYGGNS